MSDAPLHHIRDGIYIFRRGDVIYKYGCEAVQVQLANVPECYRDFPIMNKKGKNFVSTTNQMLIDHSEEEVWVPHFTRMVQWLVGINQAHFDPKGRKAEALAEVMGPGATIRE